MDSLLGVTQGSGAVKYNASFDPQSSSDLLVIQSTLSSGNALRSDSVDVSVDSLYKSLTITSQQILDKINKLLPTPITVETDTSAFTPEATADNIVKGIAPSFDRFKTANPDLGDEELVTEFFKRAQAGVDSGYNDAYETLKGFGAFDVGGVEDGVKKTKSLIDEKLKAFENAKRKELGLDVKDAAVTTDAAAQTQTGILTQGAVSIVA